MLHHRWLLVTDVTSNNTEQVYWAFQPSSNPGYHLVRWINNNPIIQMSMRSQKITCPRLFSEFTAEEKDGMEKAWPVSISYLLHQLFPPSPLCYHVTKLPSWWKRDGEEEEEKKTLPGWAKGKDQTSVYCLTSPRISLSRHRASLLGLCMSRGMWAFHFAPLNNSSASISFWLSPVPTPMHS